MTACHTNKENINTESSFPMKIGKHYRLLTYRMARQVKMDGFKANRMPKFVCQLAFHSNLTHDFRTIRTPVSPSRNGIERLNSPSLKRWHSIYIVKQKWFEKNSSPYIRWIKGVYSHSISCLTILFPGRAESPK